ncbi:MAG: metallophosphoesterase [Phycisphaerae bacterium]
MRKAIIVLLAGLISASAAEGTPPMDLTQDGKWTFRLKGDDDGAWKPALAAAVALADVAEPTAQWPTRWRTFVAWEPNEAVVESTAPSKLAEVPTTLTLGGISACRATLPLYTGGVLDLTVGHGAPWKGRWAWTFGNLKAPHAEKVTLAVTSPQAVTVWIDGRKVIDADKPGRHTAALSLSKGDHVVAARVSSSDDRWYLLGQILPPGKSPVVEARCEFNADKPGRFASLTISGAEPALARLNGKPLQRPLPEMIGDRLRGVPPELLKDGRNVLTRTIPLHRARRWVADKHDGTLAVIGLRPQDARIVMGPTVTATADGGLQVRAATDANVPATLNIDGRTLKSPAGVFHCWELDELKPGTGYAYRITPGEGTPARAKLRTLPARGEPITVALVGDPQSGKAWKDVAAALRKQRPDLVVIIGDVVVDGLVEQQWHRTFLEPAAELLASVPFRVVPGNHDRYSPLLVKLLGSGRPRRHWTLPAGGGLLVGIDGGADFRSGAPAHRWLEATLKKADAERVFVLSHYPAYSSRNHGKLAHDGRVLEWTSRAGRNRLVPLLQRYKVTALLGGHDHGYERSELPNGLSAIVTGGGGAGTYPKRDDAQKQNPWSRAFEVDHHYSLLRIEGQSATLRVLTPEGKTIDNRTWEATTAKEN